MTDDNVDVMGGSEIVNTEVKQENTGENQTQADSGQDKNTPDTVPYERLSESVKQKNEFKKKYEEQLEINNNLSQSVTEYANSQITDTQSIENKPIETIDELMGVVRQEMDDRFRPMEEKGITESYKNNVKNFFLQDKEASKIRAQMDDHYDKMPISHKEFSTRGSRYTSLCE